MRPLPRLMVSVGFIASALLSTQAALAVGESVAGFPSYDERALHMLANRARVAPELEMAECGSKCPDAGCYSPKPPLYYKRELNHAARFHAAHMQKNNYFAHTSSCTLVENIGTLFPDSCDGSASCACAGGENKCNPECTGFSDRVKLFGSGAGGEIIASGGSPEGGFYLWLYEPTGDSKCEFTQENGHRWLLLTSEGAVGFGSQGDYVGDFAGGGEEHKIASGSHWPRQSESIEAWASYFDAAGPTAALVNVDGTCTPMKLTRGKPETGAYKADLTGLGSGCHRYFFTFKDASGAIVTFPEAGSLGIGPEGTCADWSEERPATGEGCDCKPQCGDHQCGDDACGGSCGSCADGASCSAEGQCIAADGSAAEDDASCGCAVPGEGSGTDVALVAFLGAAVLTISRSRQKGRSRA